MPVLSLSSIIDILFVALIVYGFLKLLKWTHAMPALLGVALVVLLVYWAHFKGLNTMDWMVTAVAPGSSQSARACRGVSGAIGPHVTTRSAPSKAPRGESHTETSIGKRCIATRRYVSAAVHAMS